MENKKLIGTSILISVIITFFGCLIVSVIFFTRRTQPSVVKQQPVITTSISDLQSQIWSALSGASTSVVSISITKDLKTYVQDPSQVTSPGAVQTAQLGGASGILISKDGYVLTNKHVIQDTGAKYSVTLYDGTIYNVANIRFDDALDLAVLKIVGAEGAPVDNLPVAQFLPFDQSAVIGQFVLAIGNSYNQYPNSVSFGILSSQSKKLTINQTNTYIGLYQTDALLTPGYSGGPLLNLQGQVLGVNTAIVSGQGVGFALPVSQEFVATTLASLAKYGKIVRPLLGLQYTDVTPAVQKERNLPDLNGVVIADVLSGLPAAEAGLQPGDIILAINDKPITAQLPFLYHIYTYLPGSTVAFTVLRNGSMQKVPVVLGENGN